LRLLTTPTPLTTYLHIPTTKRIIFPMRLRAVVLVATLALTGTAAWPAEEPPAPTREEEKLLAEVGKRLLQGARYGCGWYVTGSIGELLFVLPTTVRPLSPWLLGELRRSGPSLQQCTDTTMKGILESRALLLGPVAWEKPSRDAYVGCGTGNPVAGSRACFSAHRSFFGRWHLTPMTQE